jgi:CrcB protein
VRTTAGTGFVGAYTTFSTFGLDLVRTAEDDGPRLSAPYLVASVVGGLVACAAGLALTGGL